MPVRVAFDTTPLVGAPTGIGEFVGLAARALDGRSDCELVRYVLSIRSRPPPGEVRWLPYPASLAVRGWRFVDFPSGRRRLHGAQVVHGTNYFAPPTGLPTVLTIHDCSFVTRPELCRPVVRAFVPAVRRAIQHGAWVHTPSTFVASQVRELFHTDRVVAIHHGAPEGPGLPSRATVPADPDASPLVLSLATLEPRKNLSRLVEAFGRLHDRLPAARLVLAGGAGSDEERISDAIAALDPKAAQQVTLAGWVDRQRRFELLSEASVLAYPSLDEGFGIPMLEAMVCEVPVVASNAGAVPEVAGDAALLVDPHDADAIADALMLAITDDALRSGLIERGNARVASFSWTTTAARLVEMYEQVRSSQ